MNYFIGRRLIFGALLLILLIAARVTHRPQGEPPLRVPAALVGYRPLPTSAYLPDHDLKAFLARWKSNINPKLDTNAYYAAKTAIYGETLEKIFSDVIVGARAISGSSAPTPTLVLYESAQPNAFVLSPRACLVNAAYFAGHEGNAEIATVRVVQAGTGDDLQLISIPTKQNEESPKCLTTMSQEILQEFSSRRFFMNNAPCTAQVEEKRLRFECPGQDIQTPIRTFIFTAPAPFIFMSTSMISTLRTRVELEAVLAHEAGHYFLGHSSTFLNLPPSYFYRREPNLPAFRPPIDETLRKLGQVVRVIGNLNSGRSDLTYYHHSLSGEIFLGAMLALAKDHDKYARMGYKFDRDACGRELLDQGYFGDLISAMKVRNPTPIQLKKVRSAMEVLKPCAQSLRKGTNSPSNFLDFFGDRLASADNQVSDFIFEGNSPAPSADAWEAFTKIDLAVSAFMETSSSRVNLKTLGFYTVEEEADVFSLNYLKAFNLDQLAMASAIAALGRWSLAHPPVRDQDLGDCLAAFDGHWMRDGTAYRPQPADYSDPHHDTCFRMLYLEEMILRIGEVHRYDSASAPARHGSDAFTAMARYYGLANHFFSELKPEASIFVF